MKLNFILFTIVALTSLPTLASEANSRDSVIAYDRLPIIPGPFKSVKLSYSGGVVDLLENTAGEYAILPTELVLAENKPPSYYLEFNTAEAISDQLFSSPNDEVGRMTIYVKFTSNRLSSVNKALSERGSTRKLGRPKLANLPRSYLQAGMSFFSGNLAGQLIAKPAPGMPDIFVLRAGLKPLFVRTLVRKHYGTVFGINATYAIENAPKHVTEYFVGLAVALNCEAYPTLFIDTFDGHLGCVEIPRLQLIQSVPFRNKVHNCVGEKAIDDYLPYADTMYPPSIDHAMVRQSYLRCVLDNMKNPS